MKSEKNSLLQGEAGPSHRYGTLRNDYEPKEYYRTSLSKRDFLLVVALFAVAGTVIGVSLGFGLPALEQKRSTYFNLTTQPSASPLETFSQYIVATDADYCAPIGAAVLAEGGSAVDAAIATLFCSGAVHPHASGIGGGVLFTIYDQKSQTVEVIDGRESAPAGSERRPKGSFSTGNFSIAIPGELRAFERAHGSYGKLPWGRLVQPTIDLCRKGFPVTKHFASALAKNRHRLSKDDVLRDAYFHEKKNRVLFEGETMTCLKLADTLEEIRDDTAATFYQGGVAERLLTDLSQYGAPLTAADLQNYEALIRTSLQTSLETVQLKMYSPPPPGNGAILSLILKVLDKSGFKAGDEQELSTASVMAHEIAEALKFGYAAKTHLGDENFLKNTSALAHILSEKFVDEIRNSIDNVTHPGEFYRPLYAPAQKEHGTAHTTVLTADGLAVSATSSVNGQFGSFIMSPRTGILLNNHMADFSLDGPADGPNSVLSGRRPMSSMAPSVLVDKDGKPRMVIGGIGGSRITSGEAQVVFRHLYLGQNVKQAVDAPRLHNQLFPDELLYQEGFPGVLLDSLSQRGHNLVKEHELSAMCAVSMDERGIQGNVDYRKGGSIAGL